MIRQEVQSVDPPGHPPKERCARRLARVGRRETVAQWLGVDPMLLSELGTGVVRGMDARREELLQARQTIATLRAEARVDPLTEALNRRGIDERLDTEIIRAQRTGDPLAVLVLDLDGLKRINDQYGHSAGDELLRCTTIAIRGELRATDHLGRIGGDEFLAVLPDTDITQAELVARRIVEAVRLLQIPEVPEQQFGISVGWASTSEGQPASAALAGVADGRLYEGRGERRAGGAA